jgi:hypothetical protein
VQSLRNRFAQAFIANRVPRGYIFHLAFAFVGYTPISARFFSSLLPEYRRIGSPISPPVNQLPPFRVTFCIPSPACVRIRK